MKRRKLLLCFVCFMTCLTACQPQNPQTSTTPTPITNDGFKKGVSHYTDGIFGFSVAFPSKWSSATPAYREATATENASPDSGITIYLDNDERSYIWIYGQHGQIVPSNKDMFEASTFITDAGLSGTLYRRETDTQVEGQLVFADNKHVAAIVRVDVEVFAENEKEIMNILQSIEP